ncbi:armadillo-type protein [Lentinula aff. lateritia]|uniref:Armadillo-type protein n=1 Tax=Lentinula aff. lateritia TaxID=2804960 RepID=A0ACC1TT70_9AGAR|nr:armadillo-type protein [Lentinula aff. lateritia]
MSKPDVQSWLSSAGKFDDDGSGSSDSSWQRDQVMKDWSCSMIAAQKILMDSKTSIRLSFLRDELSTLAKHGDLTLSQVMDIFRLLTLTYPRYSDSPSREAVEEVGMVLVKRDELRGTEDGPSDEQKMGVAEQVVGWISNEVSHFAKRGSSSSYAPSNLFVLLGWCSGLYTVCLESNPKFIESLSWKSLVGSMAILLDMVYDSDRAKPSLKKGALVRVRRALRSAGDKIPTLISTLLAHIKDSQIPLRFMQLIGVAVSVLVRLKNVKEEPVERLPSWLKSQIITLYIGSVLMTRSPVSEHLLTSIEDFIQYFVTDEELTTSILPTADKAVLRSPEYSLDVLSKFFQTYSHSLSTDSFKRILIYSINSAKSSNPNIRASSVSLFRSLVSTNTKSPNCDSDFSLAVSELLVLPTTSKTAGPDHRVALYSMLASLPPSSAISATLVQTAVPLLAKETHEGAVMILADALPSHVSFLLSNNKPLTPEVTGLIAKEMGSIKPSIRHAFCLMAGSALWRSGTKTTDTDAMLEFTKAIIPALNTTLKNVAANPLNASGGVLEAYIAIALLLGPLAKSGEFNDIVAKNPVLHGISTVGVKPSFLLWDKVYQKATDINDEKWLLRACEAAVVYFNAEISKSEALRTQFGSVFLHLALDGVSHSIRRDVYNSLEAIVMLYPNSANSIIRDAIITFLSRGAPSSITGDKPWNKHSHLSGLLLSTVASGPELDLAVRENAVVDSIIVANHALVRGSSHQTWIDLCQKANIDPREVIEKHLARLLKLVLDASLSDPKSGFPEACYRAVSTLAFVSPGDILPKILEQLKQDIDLDVLSSLTEDEFGIWATPEGTVFVDVLSYTKDDVRDKKGKDSEINKWEDELRKSLADKKAKAAKTSTLTKQQQALVQAQVAKESQIRAKVNDVQFKLIRGLYLVRSLIETSVDEFRMYVSPISTLLLDGALAKGYLLVGELAFETYLRLAQCCSERLDTFRKWIGIATLRCLRENVVPEDLKAEPLSQLVLRVLHHVRFLSEQVPFDSATFSYIYPLLNHVALEGGVVTEELEEMLEQVSLTQDIIKFHCGEFSDMAFPRKQTLQLLIHIIRLQPKLSKEASSSLVDLGESIHGSALKEEIETLVRGTLFQEVYVRNSCLQALQPFDLTDFDWFTELWIACQDEDEQNARLARHIWEDNGLDVPQSFMTQLLNYLGHDNVYVRSSTAAAISEAVELWPQTIVETMTILKDYYRDKARILAPEYDQYGMVIAQSLEQSDPWQARVAVSRAFQLLSPLLIEAEVVPFFHFLIQDEALGDRTPEVRRSMLTAGTITIDLHGHSCIAPLIAMFEEHLSTPSSAAETGDHIKEAVVILFGRVARHLDASDARIPNIVERLVEALKTPSEQVQIAVSECLSPLVNVMRLKVPTLVDSLLEDLFNAPKYASRRGAAYGLAGVIKGTGIGGMKEFSIVTKLRAASEDKKSYESRQGVLFAIETLSITLARLFEPYIELILPILLTLFGDASADVREATQDASRIIMGNMSGYGVKLILPSLLSGLDEKQWRSKKGSIELLGMMAYCSPRQLSLSLPIVIPRLTEVLTDSHAQVRAAANKSLKQFGEVISNPEIQGLVPVLLKALVDPAKTPNALAGLLKTSFMHYIDHSSLALVVPIIERGLRERGADTKKKAAQIVGNLASLTDTKDFVPYLSQLLPLVHVVLVDPVPEARATAAKALGTLVERMGEVHFPDLVPGLLRTLKMDTSGVDRQGAAQGLSEVLSGLGMERLEGLLPDIIANAQSPRATVREGFMSLLVYLPATFGSRFQPHLPKIIGPILSGLSDPEEYVREAAMRAGRMVITNYSSKAIDLLLPELERGMFDAGWRIRHASITLVGELLFKVSGISGKPSDIDEEEDTAAEVGGADASRRALVEVLGVERRDRLLAALYLVRQDGVVVVRQASIQIWKALVHNTPRTVREILPELINQIIFLSSSAEFEQQETAGRTIAEICRKFGERILGEIMPLLRSKASSTDPKSREGVCIALSEIMESTTDSQREDHEDGIIVIVRECLVDDEGDVRMAAAKAFDVLQEHIGAKAIDETIPTLLEALRQPGKGSGTALQALREVMSVRASTVFPVLIPTLTAIPMTVFNARALASLVTVAGNALSKRVTTILNAIVKVLEGSPTPDDELREAVHEALRALLESVSDTEGLNTLMLLLLGWVKHDSPRRRVNALNFFAIFCAVTELDTSIYRVDWIRQLIPSMEDREVEVHTAAQHSLDAFMKSIPKDELEPLVVPLHRNLESAGAPGHDVPGFSLTKGIAPMVPIIIAGLTTGSNDQREAAAYAIGDLVQRTAPEAFKPFVVPFTGPLIRVATQATSYPPAVKTAILSGLTSMLERIPLFVKPFFPQLQRTFVKSASDPVSVVVRTKAGRALGVLMKNQPRVDPVVTELISGIRTSEEGIAGSLVLALANVIDGAGENVGEKARETCVEIVNDAFKESHDETYVQSISTLVVSLSIWPDLLRPIVETYLVSGTANSMICSRVILAVLESALEDTSKGPNLFENLGMMDSITRKVHESCSSERPNIARPAREARELLG